VTPVRSAILAVAVGWLAAGCAGPGRGGRTGVERDRLARVGLRVVSEDEALLPDAERGRCIPCRVITGFPLPPVPPDPAGYLIVGVNREPAATKQEILEALRAWDPGETLYLKIRRNPYLQDEPFLYEVDVPVRLRWHDREAP
jgi:hypothetical protein